MFTVDMAHKIHYSFHCLFDKSQVSAKITPTTLKNFLNNSIRAMSRGEFNWILQELKIEGRSKIYKEYTWRYAYDGWKAIPEASNHLDNILRQVSVLQWIDKWIAARAIFTTVVEVVRSSFDVRGGYISLQFLNDNEWIDTLRKYDPAQHNYKHFDKRP